MVSINFSTREVNCKIVYYGPGLSGKTTNLQYVHTKVPKARRGDLISLATEADRTLYFDFLPIDIGSINGMATKFQLYTVPGQVFYNATRKLVLRGADGVVFVADSQRSKREENIESLHNLKENLAEYGYDMETMPVVLQYNKRDLDDLLTIEELEADLNWSNWHYYEASAVKGTGVFDTLKLVTKLVLDKAKKGESSAEPIPVGATVGATEETTLESETGKVPLGADYGDGTEANTSQVEKVSMETEEPERTEAVTLKGDEATTPLETPPAVEQPDSLAAGDTTAPAAAETPTAASRNGESYSETGGQMQRAASAAAVAEAQAEVEPERRTVEPEIDNAGEAEMSSAAYADTFEVPRVISMQKSLRVKHKAEKKFSLFGWLRSWFSR